MTDTSKELGGQIRKAQKVYERKKWKAIAWDPQTNVL